MKTMALSTLAFYLCTVVVSSEAEDWKLAPVIVGGTGGSGTRGVVDALGTSI